MKRPFATFSTWTDFWFGSSGLVGQFFAWTLSLDWQLAVAIAPAEPFVDPDAPDLAELFAEPSLLRRAGIFAELLCGQRLAGIAGHGPASPDCLQPVWHVEPDPAELFAVPSLLCPVVIFVELLYGQRPAGFAGHGPASLDCRQPVLRAGLGPAAPFLQRPAGHVALGPASLDYRQFVLHVGLGPAVPFLLRPVGIFVELFYVLRPAAHVEHDLASPDCRQPDWRGELDPAVPFLLRHAAIAVELFCAQCLAGHVAHDLDHGGPDRIAEPTDEQLRGFSAVALVAALQSAPELHDLWSMNLTLPFRTFDVDHGSFGCLYSCERNWIYESNPDAAADFAWNAAHGCICIET